MHGQTMLLTLFLFTVFAGLGIAVWEWLGISRELRIHGEPQQPGRWDTALRRKAESMARDPDVEEPPRTGFLRSTPINEPIIPRPALEGLANIHREKYPND